MRCLEELEPAPLLERNLSVGELDLEVGGHVARPKEHGDLGERRSLFVQLENPVHDELGLLLLVPRGHEPRRFASGSLGPEILGEPLRRA